ncbi:MAG TPA: peroxidase-related enzyme [Pirellulales bacterium]|nr:peroxidase-related enzyme [Pirellulales bacterium]
MAHIALPHGLPGILGPLRAYPETQKHLNGLAETLLRGPSSLTPAERELIATRVSAGNECYFCTSSHAAAARHLFGPGRQVVDKVLDGVANAGIDEKLRALLEIAEKVRCDGRSVTEADIERARKAGADDKAIHDTVLIAAAFSMYNRYVDGLATWAPHDPETYDAIGARLASEGYLSSD